MPRYLVVVVDTPIGERVLAELDVLNLPGSQFHLLLVKTAPRVAAQAAAGPGGPQAGSTGSGVGVGVGPGAPMDDALNTMQRSGFEVSGEVVAGKPVESTDAALRAGDYDCVVIVNGSTRIARWLKLDLASRVGRRVDEPVVVIADDDVVTV